MIKYREIRKQIILNKWPKVVQAKDGKWKREWTISITGEVPVPASLKALSSEISQDNFQVVIYRRSDREVVATVLTEEDGWSDEFFFESYRMFEKIDAKVGEIDSIQGELRDRWPPWRWHKLKLSD